MKFFLIPIFILLLTQCKNDNQNEKETRKLANLLLTNLAIENYNANCRNFYGKENSLFTNKAYYETFLNYKTGTSVLVFGDSTMDISTRYDGFLSSSSKSMAVSGNTTCDMIEQLQKINPSVNNSLAATIGGNDLLKKIANDRIQRTAGQFIDTLNRMKSGNLVVIGIHPTQVDYANENRKIINSFVENRLKSLQGCYVSPDEFFTLDADGKASSSNMLDAIHYNQTISFQLKTKIQNTCQLTL